MTRFVGHLLRHYIDAALVHDLAHLINAHRFRPPLPNWEVDQIVNSIAGKEIQRRRRLNGGSPGPGSPERSEMRS